MRRGTVFYKMTGSGNDFVVFDGRHVARADMTPAVVRAVCDRRMGAGADGVILLDPEAPRGAQFTFHFWNSDGSEGPMCGNGALCATQLASLIELAPADGEICFVTPAGLHRGRLAEGRPEIMLPDFPVPQRLTGAAVEPDEKHASLAVPSVPHLVLVVDDVDRVDLERRGPVLRHDSAIGRGGANVNWVSQADAGEFRMRTYERGVEGETFACGTGAVACGVVLEEQGLAAPPVRVWTRSGLPLDVSWRRAADRIEHVSLRGEGRLVYKAVLAEIINS